MLRNILRAESGCLCSTQATASSHWRRGLTNDMLPQKTISNEQINAVVLCCEPSRGNLKLKNMHDTLMPTMVLNDYQCILVFSWYSTSWTKQQPLKTRVNTHHFLIKVKYLPKKRFTCSAAAGMSFITIFQIKTITLFSYRLLWCPQSLIIQLNSLSAR